MGKMVDAVAVTAETAVVGSPFRQNMTGTGTKKGMLPLRGRGSGPCPKRKEPPGLRYQRVNPLEERKCLDRGGEILSESRGGSGQK